MRSSTMKSLLLACVLTGLGCANKVDSSAFEVGMTATNPSSEGAFDPTIVDAQTRLEVTVTRIDVHLVSLDVASSDEPFDEKADETSGAWITIFTGPQRIDLLNLAKNEALLARAEIGPGRVTQIRLVLQDDAKLFMGSTIVDVKCPSCGSSGLKIIPKPALVLPLGGTLRATLVVDLAVSLVHEGDGWMLRPVIRLR